MGACTRLSPGPCRTAGACGRRRRERCGPWGGFLAREETARGRRRVAAFEGGPQDVVQLVLVGAVFFAEIEPGGTRGGGRIRGVALVERHAWFLSDERRRVRGGLKGG